MIARTAALLGTALALANLTAPAFAATALLNGSVKLLAGPGQTFDTLTTLNAKTKVGVLWCGPSNFDWCLVSYHKTGGWVHTADLLLVGPDGVVLDAGGQGGSTAPGDEHHLNGQARMGDSGGGGIDAAGVGSSGVHKIGGF